MLKKILVVEDEALLAENLKAYLEKLPCEVHLAADGATGIQQARTIAPALIVLDYRLPDMDGFEVIDSLAMHWQGDCILITGHPSSEVMDSARRRNISHIMFKPFPLGELRNLVGRLLETPASQEQLSLEVIADRRRQSVDIFPLQMYDGSWVMTNRRQSAAGPSSEGVLSRRRPAHDGE